MCGCLARPRYMYDEICRTVLCLHHLLALGCALGHFQHGHDFGLPLHLLYTICKLTSEWLTYDIGADLTFQLKRE